MSELPPMKVTSLAPWFGGKRTMASDIVAELGPHKSYWEIPCGSMAVLLSKKPSAHETVVDLHGDVTTLAMVVASDRYVELYNKLSLALYCDAIFDDAKKHFAGESLAPPASPELATDEHVRRAYYFFLVSWMGRNGVAGTERVNYQMAVRWTMGGGHGGVRVGSAIESIPAWHERLRRTVILCRDLFGVLAKIEDAPGVVIYCDPPYLMNTRGDGGGSRYEFDFAESTGGLFGAEDDHARLCKALRRFRHARIVLSYYDAPRIREMYPDWTVRVVTRAKNLSVQNRRGMTTDEAPELLLINGPSLFGHTPPAATRKRRHKVGPTVVTP